MDGATMYIGGRRVLLPDEIEARRDALADARLRALGDLAAMRADLAEQERIVARIEGGLAEVGWLLGQMTPPPPESGPSEHERED
jgi:hypothetical protein